jgi:predicted dehydrogenase
MPDTMPLRWGLIGAGDIVQKRVGPALRDSPACDLIAVARARPELAEAAAQAFGATRWYADWRQVIADADVDSVYVATPVDLHAAQTIAAAEGGKHVLCEKPMALNVGECDDMMAACRANGVMLGVAYYRHFYPVIARVKSVIASEEIGQPAVAQINAFERFDPSPDDPRHWFVEKARAGGGPMFDFGCHRIEVLTNVFGPIRHVTSAVANAAFRREVEDTAAALFQFESGPCAVLTVTHATPESSDTFDVFGTKGSIHIQTLNSGEIRIRTAAGERVESHPPDPNIHRPLIEDFTEAVLTRRPPGVTGEMGRLVAEIEERIYRFEFSL